MIAHLRTALFIARKELVESFRDKNTLIYSVALPLALYPTMFWVMIQGSLLMEGRKERTTVELEIVTAEGRELPVGLEEALAAAQNEADDNLGEDFEGIEVVSVRTRMGNEDSARELAERASEADESEIDAVLWLAAPELADESADAQAILFYDSTDSASKIARDRVAARLPDFAFELRTSEASRLGFDAARLEPLAVERHNIAEEKSMGAYMLSFILPMMMVIMTVMGAVFPAVDLTAGEKERGTIETTLIAPIDRAAIHQGKILAVCATACLAAALNLFALALSAGHLLTMLGEGVRIDVPISAFVFVTPLAVLFAFFVSALLTGFSALAKSFREGQAMVGPVQILFFVPTMVGAIPGVELTKGLALVPVVNVVLAFKAMLRGEVLVIEYALCGLSLAVFAYAAIRLSLFLMTRESAIAADDFSLKRLMSLLSSPAGSK